MKSRSSSSKSVLRIGGAVVTIALAFFLVLQQANFLLARSVLIAFGDVESTYRAAWFEWDGDIVAKDLVMDPYELGPEGELRFEQLHLETPGWFWFLRNTFDRKLRTAKLDRIHLTLTGVTSAAGFEPTLGDLGPFGAASASPFEAEGCAADSAWFREELELMGLKGDPTRLEFDFRAEGTSLATTITLETPRVSRVTLERREKLPTSINALLLDQYPGLVESERWEVEDQGFVAARNRHCAKKDGIDARRFVERHVDSVERLLLIAGLRVDAATRTAYRRFARDGGRFRFGGSYAQPLHTDEFYELRASGDTLAAMNSTVDHNDRANAVQWQRVRARALAAYDEGEPTWPALEAERIAAAQKAAAEAVAAGAAATSTPTAADATAPGAAADSAAPDAVPEPESSLATRIRGKSRLASETVSAATPATGASTSEEAAGVPATPSAGAQPPVDVTGAGATTAATAAATAAPAATVTPGGLRAGSRVTWSDLPKLRGRMVRIWTIHNPPRTVDLLAASDAELRVKARLGGGHAEYTIKKDGFVRATLIR